MTALETSGGALTSRFMFPDGFLGFQGHFPGKKILPGVCQIQCALATVERAKQKTVVLREIALAKYFCAVSPEEEITCACGDIGDAGEFTFKAHITKGSTKVADLKLRVAMTGGEKKSIP
jgi:3-hydroxymyristoyl/3-hydroxydecanoyl-(acyl carrier protein) dehydratase